MTDDLTDEEDPMGQGEIDLDDEELGDDLDPRQRAQMPGGQQRRAKGAAAGRPNYDDDEDF